MQILTLSPWLPQATAPHAGGQYLFHVVESLAKRGHTVHLICYGRGEAPATIRTLEEFCASVYVITPTYRWQDKITSFVAEGWRRPWTLGRRTHLAVRERLHQICSKAAIDVVHLAWTEMGRYLDAVPETVATVLATMDVEHQVRPREVAVTPLGIRRWQAGWRARRLIRVERRYVRRADAVVAVSPADAAALARLRSSASMGSPDPRPRLCFFSSPLPEEKSTEYAIRNPSLTFRTGTQYGILFPLSSFIPHPSSFPHPLSPVHVVPPWLDTAALGTIGPESVVPGRLTFMGALDRVANQASVRFLLEGVWPQIRATHAKATLHIVGANPPEDLRRRAERDPRLKVTGWVPDLAQAWAETDIAVVPSIVGGGLLLKVAQPMVAGRPVVTTTPGNRGIAAPPEAVIVADEPLSFATAVVELLDDRKRWGQLAERGRRHATTLLDWEASMDRLEAAYLDAMQQRQTS